MTFGPIRAQCGVYFQIYESEYLPTTSSSWHRRNPRNPRKTRGSTEASDRHCRGVIDPNGRRVVAYGKLANGDPRTLDGDTIFEIGSITKVFTSLVLADMVNRKEVALDDPAAKYLPENVKMPERSGKSITVLDLSSHSSGLPSLPSNLKPKDLRNPYAD